MPICRALAGQGIAIAPRTYWARRSRPPSRRALADAALTEILAGIYEPDENGRRPPECLYGSLKMWEHLNRQGITVARCTVERLSGAASSAEASMAVEQTGRDGLGRRSACASTRGITGVPTSGLDRSERAPMPG